MPRSENPRVSVIVPAYNEEGYIEPTLRSIRNQTEPPDELIVVSNGSTDNTVQIAREYMKPNGRERVYDIRDKLGAAGAKNYGARNSNGEILVFLDADMTMDPNLFTKVKGAVQEGYVGGKTRILPTKESLYNNMFWWANNFIDELVFYRLGTPNFCSYTPFVFCRRGSFEVVGGFEEDLVATEEIRLLNRLRRRGRIKFIEDSWVETSPRRAERQGQFYGGFLLPFYHFFFPKSEKLPYSDVR